MLLGRPERDVETGFEDRPIQDRRRRPGTGERPEGGRCQAYGGLLVEAAFEGKNVALEPGQEVEPGAQPGVRELRQVRVEVDQPGQDDEWPKIDDRTSLR